MSCHSGELLNNPFLPAPSWKKNLACLAGWVASIFLSIADLWSIQQAIVQVAIWAGTLRSAEERLRDLSAGKAYGWTVEVVSTTSLLILLCMAVGFEVWVEYFYRRAGTSGLLAKRVLRVSIIQVVIAVTGVLVTVIL
jgi:hypothetical protein